MTARIDNSGTARKLIASAAPLVIVALATMAVRTPLAATYPFAALLVFIWVVSDTIMLSLLARSSGQPGWHKVLGGMAGASVIVWLGSPPAIRDQLWATPAILIGMAIIVLGHIIWAVTRAKHALGASRKTGNDRWMAAVSEVLPPSLVRLAAAELTVIHMALFRWGGPPDAPASSRTFSYHRHLAPICVTLLILSSIEIAVYHVLVGQWKRSAAILMFVVSDIGLVYLVGLIKSFRFRPILLTTEGVRVRAGFLVDQFIPLDNIAGIETSFAGEKVRDPATLNAALLAWPNILLTLDEPMHRHSLLKGKRAFRSVAFRLDHPESFVRLLLWRLGDKLG